MKSVAYGSALASLLVAALVACGGGNDGNGANGGNGDTPDATPNAGDNPYPGSDDSWLWVPLAGTQCMDGSETGIGVNIHPGSDKLLIYLEGGGACFNSFTCSGAAHQKGFGAADLASTAGAAKGVFNREDADNPFSGWSWIFVPYCTGDIFAGNNPDGLGGRVQVGYKNMGFVTDELVAKFPSLSQVILSGSSAGGFGAAYNFDRVQTAFGDTKVDLLDDSGPPLSKTYMTACFQKQLREAWNLDDTLPADCTECKQADGTGLDQMTSFLATKYPDNTFGIISSLRDGVIRLFLGWGYPDCDNPEVPMKEEVFSVGVTELRDDVLSGFSNVSMYTIDSGLHVWLLEDPVGTTVVSDTGLTDWIRALLAGTSMPSVIP